MKWSLDVNGGKKPKPSLSTKDIGLSKMEGKILPRLFPATNRVAVNLGSYNFSTDWSLPTNVLSLGQGVCKENYNQ